MRLALMLACLLSSAATHATTVTLVNESVVVTDAQYVDALQIDATDTSLSVEEGGTLGNSNSHSTSLHLFGASSFTFDIAPEGQVITPGLFSDLNVVAYGTSTIEMRSGPLYSNRYDTVVSLRDDSSLLTTGGYLWRDVILEDRATALIRGGQLDGGSLLGSAGTRISIENGLISMGYLLVEGEIEVTGGDFLGQYADFGGTSQIISGGRWASGMEWQVGSPVTLIGDDFAVTRDDNLNGWLVTGTLADGSPLDVLASRGDLFNFLAVPEPSIGVLVLFSCIAASRWRG